MAGPVFREYHTPVEMTGLYWHFVDIVWVFYSRCFTWWIEADAEHIVEKKTYYSVFCRLDGSCWQQRSAWHTSISAG